MKKFKTETKVRYAETDQMGVVYHANYLIWFELGRTALVDGLGLDYRQMEQEEGLLSPVLSVEATFLSPARYGDVVSITTWVEKYDGLRVTYNYEIEVGNRMCVKGSSVHVCVRKDDFRPVSLRRALPEWHRVYDEIKHN
ncbi:MAG: thioesterase family protein [Bacillota bacterium]|nr:thioesterase family protein [Bacillota bacterium]HHU61460.1 acyl-CoA thioesterase [Natronincola sp.]